MPYLLYSASNVVTFGDVFTSDNYYLFKNKNQYSVNSSYAYTKTLTNPNLRVYRETIAGMAITNFTQIATREALPPDVPISGPFIENYSVDGTITTSNFINLLLIDKPPVRTGFFQFYLGGFSFTGFITKLTPYTHWNWQSVGTKYTYVKQSNDLGYGIELSKNLLYTAEQQSDGSYLLIPTPLNVYLSTLTEPVEIISTSSKDDPNTYLNIIPGITGSTTLPISLYYISASDALRFIASYPDLIINYGTDYLQAQQLYASPGGARAITFDPIAYLNKYADIRTLYGYDTYAATLHYITTGYGQGRTISNSSSIDPLVGGLYDERTGAVQTVNDLIVWPHGQTLAGSASSLTYKYNTKEYFYNNSVGMKSNLLYLGVE